MRPRNKKNLEARIEAVGEYIEAEPAGKKGTYKKNFRELHVEIGCGKGSFICGMAEKNPDIFFIGIECVKNVLVTAAEKARALNLGNIVFFNVNAEYLADFFEEGEIDKIYLNFSDPWPRDKQEKHRLTSNKFLPLYINLLADKGEIIQKTDNRPLFDFSLEMYKAYNCELKRVSFDLHREPDYNDLGNVVTEYEARFSEQGVPICYARVVMPDKSTVAEEVAELLAEIEKRKYFEKLAEKNCSYKT